DSVVLSVKMSLVVAFTAKGVRAIVMDDNTVLFSVPIEISIFLLTVENGVVVVLVVMGSVVLAVENRVVVVCPVKRGVVVTSAVKEVDVGVAWDNLFASVAMKEIGNLVLTVESDTVLFVAVKGINDLVATENILLPISLGLRLFAKTFEVVPPVVNGREVIPAVEKVVLLVVLEFASNSKVMGCPLLTVGNGIVVEVVENDKIVVVVVLEFASDCKVVGCPLLTIGSGIVVEYTVEGMVVVVEIVLILVSIVGLAIINVVELGNMLFTVKSGTMFLTAEDGMGVVLEVVENGLLVSVSAGNSCMVLVLCVENMNFVFSVEGGVAAFPNMNVMALEVMKESMFLPDEVGTLVVFVCDASVLPLKETEVWVVEENVMASLTVVAEILVENGRAVAPAVKGIGVVVNEDNSLVSLDIGTDSVVLAV
uniref:Uncharacterized protein n=1 Tax=Latimeria chalumnae TaxID=7897 RepID=H3BB84_LATCH